MAWHDVCDLAGLREGITPHRIGTQALLLVRDGDAVHAVDTLCPHKFGPLEDGDVEDGCIVCPLHDAGFRLTDGAPRDGDAWAGTLPIHPARVVDGRVEVQTAE